MSWRPRGGERRGFLPRSARALPFRCPWRRCYGNRVGLRPGPAAGAGAEQPGLTLLRRGGGGWGSPPAALCSGEAVSVGWGVGEARGEAVTPRQASGQGWEERDRPLPRQRPCGKFEAGSQRGWRPVGCSGAVDSALCACQSLTHFVHARGVLL